MNTSALLFALGLAALASGPAQAGPGHDHGDEAPSSAGVALPRFAAVSEAFELVGVLDGKTLTLYLDRAASNEPVPQATLELEFAGATLSPKAQPDGSYVVTLAQAPGNGVHAVAATVTVGEEADLLAAELDLHHDHAQTEAHAQGGWQRWGLALLGAGVGLVALVRFLRRKRASTFGAAA